MYLDGWFYTINLNHCNSKTHLAPATLYQVPSKDPMQATGAVRKAALGLVSFINASPTPYHAAMEASVRLEKAGFSKLREEDEWDITPGGRYYFTR